MNKCMMTAVFIVSIVFVRTAGAMQPDISVKFLPNSSRIDTAAMARSSTQSDIPTVAGAALCKLAGGKIPQIIVWYGGKNGLTERSRDFYRDELFDPLARDEVAPFVVIKYDLTAWRGLVKPGVAVTTVRVPFVGVAGEPCGRGRSVTLSSCAFFTFLQELDQPEMACERDAWLACARTFIPSGMVRAELRGAATFADSGFQPTIIKELVTAYPDMACTEAAYARLQYLEGLWLVRTMVIAQAAKDTVAEIVFLLPQGELAFYPEEQFQRDIRRILVAAAIGNPAISRCRITVTFAEFTYAYKAKKGDICLRPYLNMPYDKPVKP